MMRDARLLSGRLVSSAIFLTVLSGRLLAGEDDPQSSFVTSGQEITPTAAPGSSLQYLNPNLSEFPNYIASGGISLATSPDGKTLVVLAAGYNNLDNSSGNLVPAASQQYVFVYDISSGTPKQTQVLTLPNTYVGIAFNPNGQAFYVSGGVDDNVHIFQQTAGQWADTGTPIALRHAHGVGIVSDGSPLTAGQDVPVAGGVAVTPDGSQLLVTNVQNDSVSLLGLTSNSVEAELDLRPGKINPADSGVAGGEYPFGVVITNSGTAYISSLRDREVDVVQISGTSARVVTGCPSPTRGYEVACHGDFF
jgi:DNA-binding beta-propeller fold protein YncE